MPGFEVRWRADPAGAILRPLAARLRRAAAVALVGAGALAASIAPAPAFASSDGQPDYRKLIADSQAAIGREVGDFSFTDSKGREVSFRDFRGRPVLVSFIYTGCFQACPVSTQFLKRAVQTARDALGDDRFHVLTIGFNQPFDNPAAMASFARQQGVDDPRWSFLTPRAGEIDALAARFGFAFEATPKGFDHITQVSVVDADGVVYSQVYGEDFDLPMLVQPLKEILSGQASRSASLENIWEKVKLYCTVYDPFTGGYRVNYSLFVEIFAGLTTLAAIVWVLVREWRRPRRA